MKIQRATCLADPLVNRNQELVFGNVSLKRCALPQLRLLAEEAEPNSVVHELLLSELIAPSLL